MFFASNGWRRFCCQLAWRFRPIGQFAGFSDEVSFAVKQHQRHGLAGGNAFRDFAQPSGGFCPPSFRVFRVIGIGSGRKGNADHGDIVLSWSWWNGCQPGRFASQSCMPPQAGAAGAKARPSRVFCIFPSARQTLHASPRQKSPSARFITNQEGNIQRMKPCPMANPGVCAVKGGFPGCSNAKLGCP